MIEHTKHSRENMEDRGATESEVSDTIQTGAEYPAHPPKLGREMVFRDGYEHKGRRYPHKLVRVFYVEEGPVIVVATVITRYGEWIE